MHPGSLELVRSLCSERGLLEEPGKVLEVGSLNVNGSYRELFTNPERYTGIDHEKGPGVDLEADLHVDFVQLLADGAIPADLVLCGQVLEHDPYPWRTAPAIVRAIWEVKGCAILVAPWRFPYHHPPDFWRFSPHGLQELLRQGAMSAQFSSESTVGWRITGGWSVLRRGELEVVSHGPPPDIAGVDSWAVLDLVAPS